MECIYCGGKTRVVNSRPQKRLLQVWRRRCCMDCAAVFTTTESVELAGSLVVRSPDGLYKPFSRDMLFSSLLQACGHRTDAISDAGALTATIIAKLRKQIQVASVETAELIAITLETLKRFDRAAAVQYGAYHGQKITNV